MIVFGNAKEKKYDQCQVRENHLSAKTSNHDKYEENHCNVTKTIEELENKHKIRRTQ